MPSPSFSYRLVCSSGKARRGEIVTPRGIIRTPAFMPVGTAGTVKALYPEQVRDAGADILLGNTYHLMLRPGPERVARLGGLHEFMRWQGPILTDSGGFQVMSLANLRQMQLDECIELPAPRERAFAAMELSLRWAERSKRAFEARAKPGQALFGIVQGGTDLELRQRSADALVAMDLDGYAVGGLAVGEGHEVMLATLDGTTSHLPADKPRYLMGVGTPVDIMEAVARGIDMFDCVLPTRSGRHGQAFTWGGKVNLSNARHADDPRPLDAASSCPAARDYSRAYLHHLIRSAEYLGAMLLSWVNTAFYQELMAAIRQAIAEDRYAAFVAAHKARLSGAEA